MIPYSPDIWVADAFFQQIVCRFGMPAVIHSDQGRLSFIWTECPISCEPSGHMNHEDNDCLCLSSDHIGAYIHELSVTLPSRDLISAPSLPSNAASAGGPAPGCSE